MKRVAIIQREKCNRIPGRFLIFLWESLNSGDTIPISANGDRSMSVSSTANRRRGAHAGSGRIAKQFWQAVRSRAGLESHKKSLSGEKKMGPRWFHGRMGG